MDKQIVAHPYNRTLSKRNEGLTNATTWTNLKIITLSERNQTRKSTYCMITFIYSSTKCKLIYSARRKSVIASGQGVWRGRRDRIQRGTRKLSGMTNIFIIQFPGCREIKCINLYTLNMCSLLVPNISPVLGIAPDTKQEPPAVMPVPCDPAFLARVSPSDGRSLKIKNMDVSILEKRTIIFCFWGP